MSVTMSLVVYNIIMCEQGLTTSSLEFLKNQPAHNLETNNNCNLQASVEVNVKK